MALDLSTVSEPQSTDNWFADLDKYIVVPREALPSCIDGKHILFNITESGHLVLSNYIVERLRGYLSLKKVGEVSRSCIEQAETIVCNNSTSSAKASSRLSSRTEDIDTKCSINLLHASRPGNSTNDLSGDSLPKSINHLLTSGPDLKILGHLVCELLEKHGRPLTGVDSSSDQQADGSPPVDDLVLSGHNLSELARFVDRLKQARRSLGLSQLQLCDHLAKHFDDEQLNFSQSLMSRFEKLHLTVRAAFRLQPYLDAWLSHVSQCQIGPNSTSPIDYHQPGNHHQASTSSDLGSIRAVGRMRAMSLVRLGCCQQQQSDSANHQALNLSPSIKATVAASNHQQLQSIPNHDNGGINPKQEDMSSDRPAGGDSQDGDESSCFVFKSQCRMLDPDLRVRRRKRTHFSNYVLAKLASVFSFTPHPTRQLLTQLAKETGHDRHSIRLWFCNRRQQLQQELKRRANNAGDGATSSTSATNSVEQSS